MPKIYHSFIDKSNKKNYVTAEIKNTAISQNVWPVAPRIPVVIELKEYARWLGERLRERNETRRPVAIGILTYLSDLLSAGIENKVHIGLLERAISRNRWAIVFDGLDEVPSDVKDSVAREVRVFIEDKAAELDADLFVLCTSRPQGYSGQFARMDGPTLTLISLNPTQALSCAMPVIFWDRPEAEARRAAETLTTAVSESVPIRELMTTPLQAHIMAVVVRGGQKPPDRRWKLFDNFYQVIRGREANRDLAQSNLARVLREEERLLRRIHNRLGFVLHSRAETSKGAQTSLSRNEFHGLVRQAVEQMKEADVDSTVATLLEAATERLVLVSTPDDGNHVRFDIRPLQEFFAAEFLYEAVRSDDLKTRLELIAGDPHWREVMHFLLSAFVEADRRTELDVLTKVLERLNGDQSDGLERVFDRRLARGAILAGRLLTEGVLDQDKGHRQIFRTSLSPLMGATDANLLRPLMKVRQENSRNWLVNVATDALFEEDISESVGAAALLAVLLPSDHPRQKQIEDFAQKAPIDYLVSYFHQPDIQHRYYIGGSAKQLFSLSEWYFSRLLNTIYTNEIANLSIEDARKVISLLSYEPQRAISNIRTDRRFKPSIPLLKFLLSEKTRDDDEYIEGNGFLSVVMAGRY